ncbi:hypothetical protein [Paenibacillus ihuae]|uniref:hypothetical protein n=1 Tax=Paenibacillus ihuae TaxID=1232431 RepID=UPI0006D58736|nr:hypothetical protein [Paenibacillus ihuae]
MKRLFLLSEDPDFKEWITEELSTVGRFTRTLESFDFFFPQWAAATENENVDILVVTETVIESDTAFLGICRSINRDSNTLVIFIHYRDEDDLIQTLKDEKNICISWRDLEEGLIEKRIAQHDTIQQLYARNTDGVKQNEETEIGNPSVQVTETSHQATQQPKLEPELPTAENQFIECEKNVSNSKTLDEPDKDLNDEHRSKQVNADPINYPYSDSNQERLDQQDEVPHSNQKADIESSLENASEGEINDSTNLDHLPNRKSPRKMGVPLPKIPGFGSQGKQVVYKDRILLQDRIIGNVVIAVAGTDRRSGTTYNAIQIASYIASENHEVACVELLNQSINPSVFKYWNSTNKEAKKLDRGFHVSGVDFFPNSDFENYIRILNAGYKYVVVDLGQIVVHGDKQSIEGTYFKEFLRANLTLISSGSALWDTQSLIQFLDRLFVNSWTKTCNIMVNLADTKGFEELTGIFTKKERKELQLNFMMNSFNSNPFENNRDISDVLSNLLNPVLPMKEKKRKFTFFKKRHVND